MRFVVSTASPESGVGELTPGVHACSSGQHKAVEKSSKVRGVLFIVGTEYADFARDGK